MFIRFFILAIFISPTLISQVANDSIKLFPKIKSIELNVGVTNSTGGFNRLVPGNSETSAFALPGIKLDAAYNIQMYKHMGVKAMLVYQNNQIDDKRYLRDLISKNPLNSYSMSAGGWNNIAAMLGVFGNFNLGKHVHFQPRFCFGFNYGLSPKIDLTVSDSLKNVSVISQKHGNAVAFSFLLGTDFKIDLAKKYQLLFGFDAFSSDLVFQNIRVENSSTNLVTFFTAHQSVGTLAFKIGICKIIN